MALMLYFRRRKYSENINGTLNNGNKLHILAYCKFSKNLSLALDMTRVMGGRHPL